MPLDYFIIIINLYNSQKEFVSQKIRIFDFIKIEEIIIQ